VSQKEKLLEAMKNNPKNIMISKNFWRKMAMKRTITVAVILYFAKRGMGI